MLSKSTLSEIFNVYGLTLEDLQKAADRKFKMTDKPKAKMTRAEAIECIKKHMPDAIGHDRVIDFYIEAGMLEIVEEPTVKIKHIDVIDKEFVIIKRNGIIVYQD